MLGPLLSSWFLARIFGELFSSGKCSIQMVLGSFAPFSVVNDGLQVWADTPHGHPTLGMNEPIVAFTDMCPSDPEIEATKTKTEGTIGWFLFRPQY